MCIISLCFCLCLFQPLFTMSVQQQSIKPLTDAEFDQLTKDFGDNAVRISVSDLNVCLTMLYFIIYLINLTFILPLRSRLSFANRPWP